MGLLFKIKGLPYYCLASSIERAAAIFIKNKIGVLPKNLIEVSGFDEDPEKLFCESFDPDVLIKMFKDQKDYF